MKQNRIFNLHLYLQGLKSTSVIAVCCMALICLIYSQNDRPNILDNFRFSELYYSEPDQMIMLVILAFVPVFVFAAFAFLRSRAATDCVNSLPQTRFCTLTSYFSAAMTWPVLIWFLYYFFIIILITANGKAVTCDGFFPPMLSFFSTLTLISGISLFAVSVTGTLFTAITAFVCTFAVPVSILLCIKSISNTVVASYVDTSFTLLESIEESDKSVSLIMLAAGLLLIAASAVLYVKRKSELSGKTSLSERSHVIMSFLVTFPVMCIPCIDLVFEYFKGFSKETVSLRPISIAYYFIFSLLVWFVFNLILKRSLSQSLISLRFSALLLTVPVIITFFSFVYFYPSASFSPDAKEVESVSVRLVDSKNSVSKIGGLFYANLDGMTFTDEYSKQVLCDALKNKVAKTKEEYPLLIPTDINYETDAFSDPYTNDSFPIFNTVVTFKMKDGQTVTRKKTISPAAIGALCEVEETEKKILYIDPDTVSSFFYSHSYNGTDATEHVGEICTFAEEFNAAPVQEKIRTMLRGDEYSASIFLQGVKHKFSIPPSFTETRRSIYEHCLASGRHSPAEDVLPLLTELSNSPYIPDHGMSFGGFLVYNGKDYSFPYSINIEELYNYVQPMASLIVSDPLISEEVDFKSIYICVCCQTDSENDRVSFLKVSEETALALIEQIDAYNSYINEVIYSKEIYY